LTDGFKGRKRTWVASGGRKDGICVRDAKVDRLGRGKRGKFLKTREG